MRFRKPLKITSRTSSITNSFVQAVIPSVVPAREELESALHVLGMTGDSMTCVYCGAKATDWDHLRPFVRKKQATGYINEIRNLVPSCGPCNQSKSGADWRSWINGAARGSPKTKGVPDLEDRIRKLEQFEEWGKVESIALRELAGAELWDSYWANLEEIVKRMVEAQAQAVRVREAIQMALSRGKASP